MGEEEGPCSGLMGGIGYGEVEGFVVVEEGTEEGATGDEDVGIVGEGEVQSSGCLGGGRGKFFFV